MSRLIAFFALFLALTPAAAAAQSGGNVQVRTWWVRHGATTARCLEMSEQAFKAMGYRVGRYGSPVSSIGGFHPTAPLMIVASCQAPNYVQLFAARYPTGEITPDSEVKKFSVNMTALIAGQTLPAAPAIKPTQQAFPRVSGGAHLFNGSQADCLARSYDAMRRMGYSVPQAPQSNWVGLIGTTSDGALLMTRCDVPGQVGIYSAATPASPRNVGAASEQFRGLLLAPPAAAAAPKPAPATAGAPAAAPSAEELQAWLVRTFSQPDGESRQVVAYKLPSGSAPPVEVGFYEVTGVRVVRRCVVEFTGDYYAGNQASGYGAPRKGAKVTIDFEHADYGGPAKKGAGAEVAYFDYDELYELVGSREDLFVGSRVEMLWKACGRG